MRYLAICLILFVTRLVAQDVSSKNILIAFYNTENLFLPSNAVSEDSSGYRYDKPGWSEAKYLKKQENLAMVIRHLGEIYNKCGPDLIGLAEVQNLKVLKDLVHQQLLIPADYGIIHFDSPDYRGIDVALLYKKTVFIPIATASRRLLLYNRKGGRDYTRDVLVVSGYLNQELIHILVNHWPSRRGGKERSEAHRIAAGKLNKRIIDSLRWRYSEPLILSMGDFNDDPSDPSIFHHITANVPGQTGKLVNPMLALYKKGYGSLAYRDRWHLFDQILISDTIHNKNPRFMSFEKAGIFMPSWLKNKKGKYKGYPLRTYSGNRYTAGFSDHFPVYVVFREKSLNPESGKPNIVRDPGEDKH
ncbi:endonuclease/exonuclease/phosphatase family protein [Robertkochia flava]|uniref:endonuclease/exonuclease/phosphatase family protein n=1 Tax=Robertkochia flava TaxID=3447986 RepID=UPI001CCC1D9A|nr:endonuclease/exonuclease/phosphatase family protein [Robertkochia marina]